MAQRERELWIRDSRWGWFGHACGVAGHKFAECQGPPHFPSMDVHPSPIDDA
jgi:hypothetical protein